MTIGPVTTATIPSCAGEEFLLNLPGPTAQEGPVLVGRRCKTCFEVQSFSEFIPKSNQCRKCRMAVRKEYQRNHRDQTLLNKSKWRRKHKEELNVYNREYQKQLRAEILKSRPPLPLCQCGNNSRFRWRKDAWICFNCQKKETRKRHSIARQNRRIKVRTKHLLMKYGQKVADIYERYMAEHPKSYQGPTTLKIKNLCFPDVYSRLSDEQLVRIHLLNELLNLPVGNIGWTCQKCNIYSAEHMFFEIDHIIPRHKHGGSRKTNLQVLCPNCHKKKTILDVHSRQIDNQELLSAIIRLPAEATGSG